MDESLFAGRYKRLYKLGQGGMGQVWRCKDTYLDIDVALKLLLKSDSEDAARRFQAEARSLASLKHKNIIGILDFGFSDDQELYMVMEYCSAPDLGELLKQEGRLEVDRTLAIVCQVLNGLRHAHGEGLVHRDIKPSNILVSEDEDELVVKLVDFGTARYAMAGKEQSLTGTGTIIGSPLYMSPEVARGQPADERSDIYSLGCVLFQALSGDCLYRGETAAETLMLHMNAPLPPFPDGLDPLLQEIVSSCLAKEPEERIQSSEELLKRLISYSDSLNVEDFPKTENIDARSGSGRMFAVVVALLIVILVAYPFYSQLFDTRDALESVPAEPGVLTRTLDLSPEELTSKAHITLRDDSSHKASKDVDDQFVRAYLADPKNRDTGLWSLSDTQVSSTVFEYIDVSALRGLYIDRTGVEEKLFDYLKNAKDLESLEIQGCSSLSPEGLAKLSGLPKLRNLAVTVGDDSEKWMDAISGFKHLDSLTIDGNLKPGDLLKLQGLPVLGRLVLEKSTPELIREADQLKVLTYLGLRGELSKEILKTLAACKIKTVDISTCYVEPLYYDTEFNIVTGPEAVILAKDIDRKILQRLRMRNPRVKFNKAG